jgi:dihydrofolate reductase
MLRRLNPSDHCFEHLRYRGLVIVTNRRKVIAHIATSADGYIARPDGDLEWLTSRPAPEGFYGMNAFMRSIDTTVLGRKTYEVSLRMGAPFDSKSRNIVFSRRAPPADPPAGVEFVSEPSAHSCAAFARSPARISG